MQSFEFNTVARIIVGMGSALELSGQCRQLGVTRPLLVTDPGLMAIGLIPPVLAALEQAGLAPLVFDEVREDPPEATVLAAVALARSGSVDGVIAVGGGSSMDVAKVVAVLLRGEQTLADMYGVGNVTGGRLPLVLVPTTAGTGSEVTPVAIITTGADHQGRRILADIAAGCGGAGCLAHSWFAAGRHRHDRCRCHGACDRGLHFAAQEKSALR